jgi:predicted PurR-regulated permease PerM
MPQQGQRILLGLLLAVLLLFLLRIAWPFASAFVLASVLAIVLHPASNWLSRRLRRPGLASFLTTLATVILVEAIVSFILVTVVKDAVKLHKALNQQSLEEGGWSAMITHKTDRIVDELATRLPLPKETIREELLRGMKVGGQYLLSMAQVVIRNMTSLLVTRVLGILFLYYLLRYGEGWVRRVAALVPLSPQITANLLRVAHHSIVANVNGVLGVALAQGLFLSLGFWFVGIGAPLLWGMAGAIASIVPFLGTTLVWVPAVIGLVFLGSYGKALALGLWGGLVVGSLDNVLRPLIVGAREKQHPVLVGFAMLGGTYAFGPLGLLLGPLLVSLTGAVVEELHRLGPFTKAVSINVIDHETDQTPETRSQMTTVSTGLD